MNKVIKIFLLILILIGLFTFVYLLIKSPDWVCLPDSKPPLVQSFLEFVDRITKH